MRDTERVREREERGERREERGERRVRYYFRTWIKLSHEVKIFFDPFKEKSIFLLQKVQVQVSRFVQSESDHLKKCVNLL